MIFNALGKGSPLKIVSKAIYVSVIIVSQVLKLTTAWLNTPKQASPEQTMSFLQASTDDT